MRRDMRTPPLPSFHSEQLCAKILRGNDKKNCGMIKKHFWVRVKQILGGGCREWGGEKFWNFAWNFSWCSCSNAENLIVLFHSFKVAGMMECEVFASRENTSPEARHWVVHVFKSARLDFRKVEKNWVGRVKKTPKGLSPTGCDT